MKLKWRNIRSLYTFLFYFLAFSVVFGVNQSLALAPGKSLVHAEAPYKHAEIIRKLVQCESRGKNIKIVDVNGYYSYGILQFQSSTWNGWSKVSGIKGSPMNTNDAMQMADWAIDKGLLHHWSCARKLGLLAKK